MLISRQIDHLSEYLLKKFLGGKNMKLSEEREAKESAEATANIPEWKKRGEALIYPERKENWHKCVEGRARDLYKGMDLVNAMEVMESFGTRRNH